MRLRGPGCDVHQWPLRSASFLAARSAARVASSMAFAQRLFLGSPLRGPCSVARIVVLAAAAHRFLLGRPCLRQLPALCLESRLFALTMGRGHPESVRPVEGNPKTITYSTSCTHLQIGREHGRPQHGLRIGR